MTVSVNKDTNLGLITENAVIGDTTIKVSTASIRGFYKGFYAAVTDGTNRDELGRILAIDTNTNTVTVENAFTHNYDSSNSTVLETYYVMRDLPIYGLDVSELGQSVLNTTPAPPGTVVTFEFNNNNADSNSTPKSVRVYLVATI
jgi:ribosomal protein L24